MTQPQVRQQRFGDGALAAGSHRHRATAVPCLNHLNQRQRAYAVQQHRFDGLGFFLRQAMWIEIGLIEFDNRLGDSPGW